MILACGEALIDFISKVDDEGNTLFEPCPGGSPLNTAVAAARLGVPTGFLGRLSTDMFGEQLMGHIEANRIDPSFVLRSDAPSTFSFVRRKADDSSEYAFYAKDSATWDLTREDIPSDLVGKIDCFQFGSISMLMLPFADTVTDFIAREGGNVVVSFDPNIRPGMIESREDYLKQFERWVGNSTIVKMSDEDLHWLYPGLTVDKGLDEVLALGPALAVFTLGDRGAVARNENGNAAVPIFRMPLIDTVGAGDTFHGSLLAWLHRRKLMTRPLLQRLSPEKLREALRFAVKAAAVNCSRRGADPPWSGQVEE